MASLITLTSADPGNPPVTIAPAHVVSVVPRKQMRPDMASQTNYVRQSFAGSKVHLVTGMHYNVEENHDVVKGLVSDALGQTGLKLPPSEPPLSISSNQPPQPSNPVPSPAKKVGAKSAPPVGESKVSEEEDVD